MASKRDLLVRLDSEFNDKGFKSAEASAKALAKEMDRLESEERKLASMQMAAAREDAARRQAQLAGMEQVGRGAVAMGATVAIGLGLSAKAAMDWESAWAGVRKTVDGSDAEMAALEGELRGLAKVLPATHEEIAAVAEAAGQLGVKRADIAAFTKTAIDMGESTNLSAEEAATSLAQLGNVMGVLPSQADRAGAALVALGNDGASTEADILAMSLRIAGAGRTIGLTEAEVMGFASALSSVGIEAEAGGSAISRVMVDIAQATREGGDKLETFAQVAGMSSEQFTRAFQEDASGAVIAFVDGLGDIQKSGGDTFRVLDDLELSEIRVRDALLRASSAGDLLTESVETGSRAWEENTALVDEASRRYETAESRILMARNSLNDAAIDIGAVVLPAFAGLVERTAALADVFAALPAPVQTGVTALGGIVATIGLVGGSALILVPKLHELHTALAAMGPTGQRAARGLGAVGSVLMGPWGLALAAGTLALGVYAESQYRAQQRVEALSQTLDKQTGAVTENTREMVKNELAAKGWWMLRSDSTFDQAEQLGIALDDVTDAALGNDAAIRRVNAQLDEWRANLSENKDELRAAGINYDELGQAVEGVDKAINRSTGAIDEARKLTEQKTKADGEAAEASEKAAESQEFYTSAVSAGEQAAKDAADAVEALSRALDEANGAATNAVDAEIAWHAALEEVRASLEKNGKTLDLNTEAGRENMTALQGMRDNAQTLADTILKETGSEEQMRRSLEQSRAALKQTAIEFGMTEEEAQAYIDRVLAVPPTAETTVALRGAEDALARIDAIAARLGALNGTTASVGVRFRETGGGTLVRDVDLAFHDGGKVPGAPSPVDNRVAEVATGEWIINAASSQRYDPILRAINEGTYEPRGGFGGGSGGFSGPIVAGLSTEDVWRLAHAMTQVQLTINGQVVSEQVGRDFGRGGL